MVGLELSLNLSNFAPEGQGWCLAQKDDAQGKANQDDRVRASKANSFGEEGAACCHETSTKERVENSASSHSNLKAVGLTSKSSADGTPVRDAHRCRSAGAYG